MLALNNTWVLSDSSVMSLRFGMTRFPDNNTLSLPFDPATLGFSSNYISLITVPKFPQVRLSRLRLAVQAGPSARSTRPRSTGSRPAPTPRTRSFFGTSHRQDRRRLPQDRRWTAICPGDSSGFFYFDNEFTSANDSNSNATSGNSVASFLLGYPSANSGNISQFTRVDAAERVHLLHRRLRAGRLARELEVHAQLRPAPRARDRPGRAEQQLHRRLRSDGDQRAVVGDHDSGRPGRRHGVAHRRRRPDVRRRQRQPDDAGQPAQDSRPRRASASSTRSTPTRCCAAATGSTGRRTTTRRRARRPATTARSASRRTRSCRRRPVRRP